MKRFTATLSLECGRHRDKQGRTFAHVAEPGAFIAEGVLPLKRKNTLIGSAELVNGKVVGFTHREDAPTELYPLGVVEQYEGQEDGSWRVTRFRLVGFDER